MKPGGRRTEVIGFEEDVLHLRVAAHAREGKANEAVLSLLSGVLDISKSRIRFLSGERARYKILAIDGLGMGDLKRILSAQ